MGVPAPELKGKGWMGWVGWIEIFMGTSSKLLNKNNNGM